MKPIWPRVLLAFLLSLSCFGMTHFWYISSSLKDGSRDQSERPLAYLVNHIDEVLTRPSKKLVWYPAENQKEFSVGDSIRTGSQASALIEIYSLGRTIELEASSIIVIEEDRNELALNILEGQLTVNPASVTAKPTKKGVPRPQLLLKKGKDRFNLTKASARVDASSESLKLEVLSGVAQNLSNSESLSKGQIIERAPGGGRFRVRQRPLDIINPPDGAEYSSPSRNFPVEFKWKSHKDQGVRILIGSEPSRLKAFGAPIESMLASQEFILQLEDGLYYWKLQAFDPDEKKITYESPLNRLRIRQKIPPTPVLPRAGALLTSQKTDAKVLFAWVSDPSFEKNLLQLATDSSFLKNEKRFAIPSRGQKLVENLTPGTYFWRVISYPKTGVPNTSTSYRFRLKEWTPNHEETTSLAPESPEPEIAARPRPKPEPEVAVDSTRKSSLTERAPTALAPSPTQPQVPPSPPASPPPPAAASRSGPASASEQSSDRVAEKYKPLKAPKFKSIEVQ